MKHEIFWKNPGYEPRPELKGDIECDYLIVGGGIAGVSTAYFLSKLGAKNVVLIEKNQIASGATGKAAGSLVVRGESDLMEYLKIYGSQTAEKYWNYLQETLKSMHGIIEEEGIDCDAEPQDTIYAGSESDTYLYQEYEEEKKLDARARLLKGDELKAELNTDLYAHAILSAGHGLSVNPLKFTQNLSKAVEKHGVRIYENTSYLRSEGHVAETSHGRITYKKLVLAIDADHAALEVMTQNTTIAITRPLTAGELAETGMSTRKIIWDGGLDYHYLKVTKDSRFLLGYGITIVDKGYRDTVPNATHLEQIEKYAKELFPYLDLALDYVWSGNFGVTKDYEPHFKSEGDIIEIAGAGSQVVCLMAGEYIARRLLGLPSRMEGLFPSI